MSRTPIIRRIAAIAVAIAIPFAAASSAEAYTITARPRAPLRWPGSRSAEECLTAARR